MNKSGFMNKSNGGPEDELVMSLDETDFAISESNFSHSMMSNKIGSFVGTTATGAAGASHGPKQQPNIS